MLVDKLADGEMVGGVVVDGIGNEQLKADGEDKEQEDPKGGMPSITALHDPIEECFCVIITHG